MKKLKTIIKGYFVLFMSGWRMVSVFGYPPSFNKRDPRSYLVTSGDGTIIDHCIFHGDKNNIKLWQQAGFPSEMYPEYRDVSMWKPINRLRWYSAIASS